MKLVKQINKEDIKKVISYSQNIPDPKIDNLLDDWAKAKTVIAQRFFDSKITYTYPEKVRFEINEITMDSRVASFIDYVTHILDDWYHPLCEFLKDISTKAFYNNTLETDYVISSRDNKTIQKGSKVIKAFKYFIEDKRLLSDLQNKASELIQENKIEGYLTFSVHPLDFLSSSENTYNWRSCHSLDGEYRAGNLSYMCDTSTVMVYLSQDKEEWLPNFPKEVMWNSKKWRLLLHFSESLDVCFAGRQYPFFSPGALEVVGNVFKEELSPLISSFSIWDSPPRREEWCGWYNDYINHYERNNGEIVELDEETYCIINHNIYNITEIVTDAENSRHFNDVLRSSCYSNPYYMYRHKWGKDDINIQVGSAVKCLWCGENIIDGHDSMMCHACECKYGNSESDDYHTCDCCGSRVYYTDSYWIESDEEYVCPACAENETFICERCGERHYNANKYWNDKVEGYVCGACNYDERRE